MDDLDPSVILGGLSSKNIDEISSSLFILLEFLGSGEDSIFERIQYNQIYRSLISLLCTQQNEDVLNNTTLCIIRSARYIQSSQNTSPIIEKPTQVLQNIFTQLSNQVFKTDTKIHILHSLFHIIQNCLNQNTIFDFSKFPLLEIVNTFYDEFDATIESNFIKMLTQLWTFFGQFKYLNEYRNTFFGNLKCLTFLFSLNTRIKKTETVLQTQQLMLNIMFTYKIFLEDSSCLLLIISKAKKAEKSEITDFIELLNSYLVTYPNIKNKTVEGLFNFCFDEFIAPGESPEFVEIMLVLANSFIPKPPLEFVDELFDSSLFQWNVYMPNELYVQQFSRKMINIILNFYEKQSTCKLIALKSLASFSTFCKISPSDSVLYNLSFDAKEQQYAFYISIIVSNLTDEKRKLIFRTGIFNTLQCHQFESEKLNGLYLDYLDNRLQYEEYILPDELLNPESLTDILTAIKNKELFLFDFLSDSNDLFNNCWDLLATSEKPELIEFVNFIFSQGLSILQLPPSPKDPYPLLDYTALLEKSIKFPHSKVNFQVEMYAPLVFTEIFLNEDYQEGIVKMEVTDNPEMLKMFHDFDQVFNHRYSTAVIAKELHIAGFKHYAYKLEDKYIESNHYFLKCLLDVMDDTNDLFKSRKLEFIEITPQNEADFSKHYLHKTKERMNKNDPIPGMNQFIQNLFELLNEINIQDSSIDLINEKFTKRLLYQLASPILTIGCFTPCSKLMIRYPFLFKFEDRFFFFKVLLSELSLVVNLYSLRFKNEHAELKPSHTWHMKVPRDDVFDCGNKILQLFGKYEVFLEFSFDGETGVGTGPNREFFSLMSKEFCLKKRGMWRYSNDSDDPYCFTEKGLFPVCTAADDLFYKLGLFVGKAIQMDIMIDIPFNPSFFDLANGRTIELEDVDEQYAKSLSKPSDLYGLTFVYSVNENECVEMIPNGKNIEVSEENVKEYIRLFKEFTIGKKIRPKIDAFINGFKEIIDVDLLALFSGSEITRIVGGDGFNLTMDMLKKYVKLGSGFGPNSEQIRFLFEIIVEMDYRQKTLFWQFITGSSRLPIGGLAAIHPPLTVARRVMDNPLITDNDPLPTVLTCTHYFKLPAYTTKEIMKEKLMKAVMEGRENFTQT